MVNKNNQTIQSTVRYVAVEILENIEKRQTFSNIELDAAIKKRPLSSSDVGLLTELVYGVTQRKITLDYYLEPFVNQAKKIDLWVKQLLRVSAYQLVYLDKIPDHAVLHEAVEIAKKRGHKGISGFVNGVLRNFQRKPLRSFEEIKETNRRLSIQYSAPVWLIDKYIAEIGFEETEKMFASLLVPSKVSMRVNHQLSSVEEVLRSLKAENINAETSEISPFGLVIESGKVARSKAFIEGKLTIQDETSMLVAPTLNVKPHHKVLDACAAPGGKTTHIAAYLSPQEGGEVVALDLHEKKLKFIQENADRLQVYSQVRTRALDARKVPEVFPKETFDRILVDAPCSGLGLMRRKPDIKYAKSLEDIQNLSLIQYDILKAVAETLKPGGELIYSTCTITKEENQQVIEKFLKTHPEFELIPVVAPQLKESSFKNQMVQIYPHDYHTDGFFIARLRKKRTE